MDHFTYQHGIYHAEGVSLEALAELVGTPFYCYSSATLTRHVQVLRDSFHTLKPRICYAVKANNARGVIATLARAGVGADVVSAGEIHQALAAGIAPQNIVFSGIGKTRTEMEYALERNIFQFNVESAPELELLNEVAHHHGHPAPVALRVNPDVDPKTHAKISTGQKESKFGIGMAEAAELYERARHMAGIHVQGVSMHIGSQLTLLDPFEQAFTRLRGFIENLRGNGHNIRTIDLGGGLGVPYHHSAVPPAPRDYAAIIERVMQGVAGEYILEPGRLLVANAGILVTRVLYVKDTPTRRFVVVDAGMNDLMRPSLYDAYHDVVPLREPAANAVLAPCDLVGPVCETGDIFASDRPLPPVAAGDMLVFRTTGAYGSVMAGTYNTRPLIPELMVHGHDYAIIRARQTYDELLARDHVPGWLSFG